MQIGTVQADGITERRICYFQLTGEPNDQCQKPDNVQKNQRSAGWKLNNGLYRLYCSLLLYSNQSHAVAGAKPLPRLGFHPPQNHKNKYFFKPSCILIYGVLQYTQGHFLN